MSSSGDLIGLIGLLVGAIGVWIALKGIKRKLPRYSIRSMNLIEDRISSIDSLQMRYGGEAIRNLTVSEITFWNAGRDTIQHDDIPEADPPRITVVGEARILRAVVLERSSEANQAMLQLLPDQQTVRIVFDYLDQNEGIVIQVLHTGLSEEDLEFNGSIKGAGRLRLALHSPIQVAMPLIAVCLGGSIAGIIVEWSFKHLLPAVLSTAGMSGATAHRWIQVDFPGSYGVLTFAVSLWFGYSVAKRIFRKRVIPRNLRMSEEALLVGLR